MYLEKSFTVPAQDSAHKQLAQFLLENAPALISAASLLGGREAVRKTAETIEGVSTSAVLTNRHRRHLEALYRLLSLQGVDADGSIEAACFAEIDPSLPFIEEICLLTDQLAEHLAALSAEDARNSAARAA